MAETVRRLGLWNERADSEINLNFDHIWEVQKRLSQAAVAAGFSFAIPTRFFTRSTMTPACSAYPKADGTAIPPQTLSDTFDRDAADLARLGRTSQFPRNFTFLSALSFTIVLQATWEFLLISVYPALFNGGLAGLFYTYLWTFAGFSLVVSSLAEMASMAPTSGGQYHWVSESAPPRWQKLLSYITGWQATLAWQAGTASGSLLIGTIVQGLIGVNDPDYISQNWRGTLLIFAMVLVLCLTNVYGAGWLADVQIFLFMLHVVVFIVIIGCLWGLAEHRSGMAVFTEFYNGGGWQSTGVSVMIGQVSAIYGAIASDAAAHMAEEVKDASLAVPRAIVWTYLINGIMGLILILSFTFAIPNIEDSLNDTTGFPFLYVFRKAMPPGATTALTVGVLVLAMASNITFNVATSRQAFAFARDKGLPFSGWISKVHPTLRVPVNAILLTCAINLLLSLVNIGSAVALNAIISLTTGADLVHLSRYLTPDGVWEEQE
ncbi:MAG: hypothetical protein MMC23_002422 [Stictis urceolatum]|nr:hypothetical protein [Stictis urceolata]